LVAQAAAGLALRELERQRSRELAHQTALTRAARALGRSLELADVLTALAREADLALGGDTAGIYLADGSGGGIATAGHDEPPDWYGARIGPGEGVGGQVLVSGRAVVSNAYAEEVVLPDIEGLGELETAVAVPMSWEGELKGTLAVGFKRKRRISDEDLGLLEAIADLAALACRNAEAYEVVRSAARTDSLTGVLNHGAMQMHLREEIDRARRSGEPLSCMIIDLDNFKQLNDRAGHLVGDQILQRVAEVLAREFHPREQLARFGGDEFVLLLPGVDVRRARLQAERIRASVRDVARSVSLDGSPLEVSIGLAAWSEPLGAPELLERADRALLLAKRTGRARVAVASPETEHALAMLVTRSSSPSDLMRQFWDMVAACETPREAITNLPALTRRALTLEEVALYEIGEGVVPVLRRTSEARNPGDPSQRAFVRTSLTIEGGGAEKAAGAAIARGTLRELHAALGVQPHALDERAPSGSYAAVPLIGAERLFGVLILRSASPSFPLERLHQAELLGRQSLMVLLGQSGDGSAAAVKALAAAIDARDNYTHEHSEEVVALAAEVASSLHLADREVARVRTGALLHDVGKVAIPNEILHKGGRLSEEEWEVMRQHPIIGAKILSRTPELAHLAQVVRHEHEHWDGSGYPDGISGDEIPIASRIILACDAYSAMIAQRPYSEPMSETDAIAELRRAAEHQFDPAVVEALVRVLAGR
jgi:diguanylate cyclase (GGDEF)-like protein/putative nucleotidyltransferase with HDIG domain